MFYHFESGWTGESWEWRGTSHSPNLWECSLTIRCSLESLSRHSLGRELTYLIVEVQLAYSTASADRAKRFGVIVISPRHKVYLVAFCPSPLFNLLVNWYQSFLANLHLHVSFNRPCPCLVLHSLSCVLKQFSQEITFPVVLLFLFSKTKNRLLWSTQEETYAMKKKYIKKAKNKTKHGKLKKK